MEKISITKICLKIFFSYAFNFLKKYTTPYMFFKNLGTNKISINRVNHDQIDFVFNLKGCNVSRFFKKKKKERETKDLNDNNFYEKIKTKVTKINLQCKKSKAEIEKFLAKIFNKDITDQKSILLNTMKLFDIGNTTVSLFRNGFIRSLKAL